MANSTLSETIIHDALRRVKYPGFSRDILSFGLLKDLTLDAAAQSLQLDLAVTTQDPSIKQKLESSIRAELAPILPPENVTLNITVNAPKKPKTNLTAQVEPASKDGGLSKVKYAIAVASGKGGVGKSTVAANLAVSLANLFKEKGLSGTQVGLMDCDIYGPSMPLMMGINSRPEVENNTLIPLENYGVKVISMGMLIDEDSPVVWRGPMIMKTIQQFATQVNWGDLEVLVVDLPPGTGDAQLSLVQTIPLDGALIVSTPQTVAVSVAYRGAKMFEKVNVPLLGVVENMSYWTQGDQKQFPFGQGGGAQAAQGLQTELIGQLPLDETIRIGGDRGIPVSLSHPESEPAQQFAKIAQQVYQKIQKA